MLLGNVILACGEQNHYKSEIVSKTDCPRSALAAAQLPPRSTHTATPSFSASAVNWLQLPSSSGMPLFVRSARMRRSGSPGS